MSHVIRQAYFLLLDLDSGVVRLNTSIRDLEWEGEMWLGAAMVGDITSSSQNIEMAKESITLTLSGVPKDKIINARAEKYRNREATVWLATFDEQLHIEGAPKMVFGGSMSILNVYNGADTATISIEVESPLASWERSKVYRYTDQMQQSRFPGDLGFQYVPEMQELKLEWGQS